MCQYCVFVIQPRWTACDGTRGAACDGIGQVAWTVSVVTATITKPTTTMMMTYYYLLGIGSGFVVKTMKTLGRV